MLILNIYKHVKAIGEAATTATEIFNIPIEDALYTGILRVKGCVKIRDGAAQCHHLVGNVESKFRVPSTHRENDLFFSMIFTEFNDYLQG